jgi:hypothetical protein
MRYSNFAKIIDPNSEYYGQVFEVTMIDFEDEDRDYIALKVHKKICEFFSRSQIQFCVTKDNEPVKVGEEVVSIGDYVCNCELYDWVQDNEDIKYYIHTDNGDDYVDCVLAIDLEPLHPTNKIKITAEGKEYWISRERLNEITK